MTKTTWNPRYVIYAKEHKRTSEQQLEWDRALWPGGMMCGFTLWISERKEEFRAVHPEAFINDSIFDQAAWDEFLQRRVK
jgi:hypothetical protein